VVSRGEGGAYQLLAGERRWRAAQLAGLETVPAVVKETTPLANLELALVENLQRDDLNALEVASAYRQLLEEHGLTQEALGRRVGRSRVAITNTLRLLQLPAPAARALLEGTITEGHARAILGAPSEQAQLSILERIVRDGLSVRQTEELARLAALEPVQDAPSEPQRPDPDLVRLEDGFRYALGTRVKLVRRGPKGGRLVIYFHSDDELQGLYETITRA
jgi:ParB family chromosome partitioning protein